MRLGASKTTAQVIMKTTTFFFFLFFQPSTTIDENNACLCTKLINCGVTSVTCELNKHQRRTWTKSPSLCPGHGKVWTKKTVPNSPRRLAVLKNFLASHPRSKCYISKGETNLISASSVGPPTPSPSSKCHQARAPTSSSRHLRVPHVPSLYSTR